MLRETCTDKKQSINSGTNMNGTSKPPCEHDSKHFNFDGDCKK